MKGRFSYLFVSLLLLLLVYPFFKQKSFETFVLWVLGLFVFAAAIYADSDSKKHSFIAASLGISYLGLSFMNLFLENFIFSAMLTILAVVFFTYTIKLIIEHLLNNHELSSNTVYGAAAVYLLLGVIFASIFHFASIVDINSFSSDDGVVTDYGDHLYFSFVTLTTVGYGDVHPDSKMVRSLSVFEAVLGQLYLAVLVALLISNILPKRRSKNKKKKSSYSQKTLK